MRDLGYARPQIGPNFPDHARKPRIPPGKWSLKYERCRGCGGTELPLQGLGFCTGCYPQERAKKRVPRVEPGTALPRRNPRRKGIHQVLSEAALDGAIEMLKAGASILEVRDTYGVGVDAIRVGLKSRGLTLSRLKLQAPATSPRVGNRRHSVTCLATTEEYQTVRAYAVEYGMTISEVVRMALTRVGLLGVAQAEG
jgi:hypothetical protein